MILHDAAIRAAVASGRLGIEPFDDARIQPASVDLMLGTEFRFYVGVDRPIVDPLFADFDKRLDSFTTDQPHMMRPLDFLLGHTVQKITLPPDIGAMVVGLSTVARMGLQVEAAGWVDPGFSGQLTLELFNQHNGHYFRLRPGMVIAQIVFYALLEACERPYGAAGLGSRYQLQHGAVGPRVKGS